MHSSPDKEDRSSDGAEPIRPLLHLWSCQSQDYAVVFLDLEAKVVAANPAIELTLGYRPDELVGQSLQRIFTPEDLALGLDRHELELATQAGRSEDDRWHLRKDGRRAWISGVLMLLRDAAGRPVGFAKTLRDRTDLRAELDSLRNRVAEAAAEATRRSNVLATASHELRNPLHTLGAALQALQQAGTPTDRLVGIIGRQVATLQRLLDDLRMETPGEARPAFQPIQLDLQEVVRSAVALHEAAAATTGLYLRAVLPGPRITLEADPIRLEQILRNLIGNAVKYTPRGGTVVVSATVEGRDAVIRVQDDGIGISPEVLPRVFDLFTREERRSGPSIDGSGVGLAVVRDLVRLHEGIVEVQSAGRDRGSEFTVRLPLRQGRSERHRP